MITGIILRRYSKYLGKTEKGKYSEESLSCKKCIKEIIKLKDKKGNITTNGDSREIAKSFYEELYTTQLTEQDKAHIRGRKVINQDTDFITYIRLEEV